MTERIKTGSKYLKANVEQRNWHAVIEKLEIFLARRLTPLERQQLNDLVSVWKMKR